MTVEHVEVLVEEPSMEAALGPLLARILGETSVAIHPHQGKADLLAKLPGKLRAYRTWLPATYRIVVIVDRDEEDCRHLKARLELLAKEAGLRTRSAAKGKIWTVVNRVAIEELEAWFFGDWRAVRAAYPRARATVPQQAAYRNPDEITGGTWETFERVLQSVGYFRTGLRKIEAAGKIAEHMDPARNGSPSFRALRDALGEMMAE